MRETRTLTLTENEFLDGYEDPSDPNSDYDVDSVIGLVLNKTFPNSTLNRETCYSYSTRGNVYLQEGNVEAYVGDMRKIIRDIKRVFKGKRKERDNRAIKITATHKLPLKYKIKFNNPFKSNLYSHNTPIKLKIEKRHYHLSHKYITDRDFHKSLIFKYAVKVSLLEYMNEKGKINIMLWGWEPHYLRISIEDIEYKHRVGTLPRTDKFHTIIEASQKQNYEEITLDVEMPSRFVGEFKKIEEYPSR